MSYLLINDVGKNTLDRVNKILAGVPGGAFKATYSALKRAGDRAKTQAGRFASAEYAISKGTFMANTTEKTLVTGNHTGVARIEIKYAGHVLPLLEFRTRYTKDGNVSTQVMRNGGATTLSHAFAANVYGSRTAIYERLGNSRFPVEELYGPSTAQMMQNDDVIEQMEKTIYETYEQRIEHEILRVLNGWGG